VHSLTTNHFFDSGNVIFDENIPYRALHEVSSTPIDYSPLPFPTNNLEAATPDLDLPSTPDDGQPLPSSHDVDVPCPNADGPEESDAMPLPPPQATTSSRPVLCVDHKLTGGGQLYAEFIQVAKLHLEK